MKFEENGFLKVNSFFSKQEIENLLEKIKKNYQNQFDRLGLKKDFTQNMIDLFNKDFNTFSNCGKHNQHGCIELYQLATNEKLIKKIKELGISRPSLSTRPVVMQNHRQLSLKEVYYRTPPHQDWGSIRGSKNSIVVWIPLMDVTKNEGPVNFIPKSHKSGLLKTKQEEGFATVDVKNENFIFEEMKVGDVLFFSTFLIHKSGDILNDKIRWSCHFRFNDMDEKDFVNRGYHFNYNYYPIMEKE